MERNLNLHGSAARCLLRVRENKGKPVMSDVAFLEKFGAQFPAWEAAPGALTLADVRRLMALLEIGSRVEVRHEYDAVLAHHRAGHPILVTSEPEMSPTLEGQAPLHETALLQAMDASTFSLWRPLQNGMSDDVRPAGKLAWQDEGTIAVVLLP